MKRRNWAPQPWLLLTADDLCIEERQCRDEGKDLTNVAAEFAALQAVDLAVEEHQQRAEALLDRTADLPYLAGYPHREPSDLVTIQAERPAAPALPSCSLADAELQNKALGGWLGRASGCLLGKPVEGRRRAEIAAYLTAQGRWPLQRYFSRTVDAAVADACHFPRHTGGVYEEDITGMPEDDDTNYTVTGLAVVTQYGADFTPDDVARFWLTHLPIFHVCTAERIAYKNLVSCIPPPASAAYRNVYREWIGAQIRADFFGYVNPGLPARAAEFAWRDAAISHVKNGIYGAMWVAAMLATAYVCDDRETVIRAGLAQIPATSRLTAAIERMIALFHSGAGYTEAVDDVHARWDESVSHHWCHTISNAEIVALALLWGHGDLDQTICGAVMPGFDTDCNGATAGSVLGIMLGADRLPAKWITPLNDTLHTGVAGYPTVSLTQLAAETVELIHTLPRGATAAR